MYNDEAVVAGQIVHQLHAEKVEARLLRVGSDHVIGLKEMGNIVTRLRVMPTSEGPWVYLEYYTPWHFCPDDGFNVVVATTIHVAYVLSEREIEKDLVVVRYTDDLCSDNGLAILTPVMPPLKDLPRPLVPFLDDYQGGYGAAADILLPVKSALKVLYRTDSGNQDVCVNSTRS